jgi:N-methylhydantoinase A
VSYFVGVDIGGTFTDVAVIGPTGTVHTGKAPTTPDSPERGCLDAITVAAQSMGVSLHSLLENTSQFVHGTTMGLNAITSRSGPPIGLITTRGHGDAVLIMNGGGRTAGLDVDQLAYLGGTNNPVSLVPRKQILEVNERMDCHGQIVVALDENEVAAAVRRLVFEDKISSIGVCFLWSFLNPAHELRAKSIIASIAPDVYVCCSSELAPILGEYERCATTVVNTYIGRVMDRYIDVLQAALGEHGYKHAVNFIHCAGGLISARAARSRPVFTLNSGPVGGVLGSVFLGAAIDRQSLITTDMGGTTFDVAVIDSGKAVTRDLSVIQQYEIHLPMVDIESVGAGGGSIAWLDGGGGLQVGPKSAGAVPGPACYGRGGHEPTVTDADVVLGVINPEAFLRGTMRLDAKLAYGAVERLATKLNKSVDETAAGIARIVDSNMAGLIRRMTLNRGRDPRDMTLLAFGGGGPAHAGWFAKELGLKEMIVPMGDCASVWSALGAASGDLMQVKTMALHLREPFERQLLSEAFEGLEAEVLREFAAEGLPLQQLRIFRFVMMKFGNQVFEVEVELHDATMASDPAEDSLVARFVEQYESRYGAGSSYREAGVFITAIRVRAFAKGAAPKISKAAEMRADVPSDARGPERGVYWYELGKRVNTHIYHGEKLHHGNTLQGPAIIELPDTTVTVRPGQSAFKDALGNFLIKL